MIKLYWLWVRMFFWCGILHIIRHSYSFIYLKQQQQQQLQQICHFWPVGYDSFGTLIKCKRKRIMLSRKKEVHFHTGRDIMNILLWTRHSLVGFSFFWQRRVFRVALLVRRFHWQGHAKCKNEHPSFLTKIIIEPINTADQLFSYITYREGGPTLNSA